MKRSKRLSFADLSALIKNSGLGYSASKAASSENGAKQEKRAKYRNRKVDCAGMTFDSQLELDRWLVLCNTQKAGHIRNLKRQVWFVLAPSVDLREKRRKPALRYKADFAYELMPSGEQVVEDAKGMVTPEYRIKKHLMMSVHGILIREV